MQRRQFLSASLATSAIALATKRRAADLDRRTPASSTRFAAIALESGPQTTLTESYFGDALIPALTRMGMGPIGAFRLDIGPETPVFYVLIPGPSVDALAELDLRLAKDAEFLKAADPFWSAPATAPAFQRVESPCSPPLRAGPSSRRRRPRPPRPSASFSCAPTRAPATATTCARWRCSTPASSRSSRTPASTRSSSAIR